jgi:hypothetical protein
MVETLAARASLRQPDPATVAILLDTTWRVVEAEQTRRECIERKASALATFTSLALSLTATLGARFLRLDDWWVLAVFLGALAALAGSGALALSVLLPRRGLTLGTAYLERFPSWTEIGKPPAQVQGETMRGLVATIGSTRALNARTARTVFAAFVLLFLGLVFVTAQAVALSLLDVR